MVKRTFTQKMYKKHIDKGIPAKNKTDARRVHKAERGAYSVIDKITLVGKDKHEKDYNRYNITWHRRK